MPGYRVSFYKTLLSSCGMPQRCLQAEISIADAPSPSDAARMAERKWQKLRRIPDWKLGADLVEVHEGTPRKIRAHEAPRTRDSVHSGILLFETAFNA